MDDLFGHGGGNPRYTPRSRSARAKDCGYELTLRLSEKRKRVETTLQTSQKILIVGVEVPSRAGNLKAITDQLSRSIHKVDVSTIEMKPQGKFANVDEAIKLAPNPLAYYDWLVITDDDVKLSVDFLDRYISYARTANLAISQPAHRFASHASYEITRRRFGSLVRASRFVEIGPLTFLSAETFDDLLPFPPSRWCWGIDVIWSDIAQRRGWTMGIVDAMAIGHMRPVAASYSTAEAVTEGRQLLQALGINHTGADLLTCRILLPA